MPTKVTFSHNIKNLSTTISFSEAGNKRTIKLGALEVKNKLSPSGKYLVVQLANSQAEDSGKFIKIDTKTGSRIFTVQPEWGWADDFDFQGEDENLLVAVKHGKYKVSNEGILIDRATYYYNCVSIADTATISAIPDFLELHGKSTETISFAINALDRILISCSTLFHGKTWAAQTLKAKVGLLREQDKPVEAMQACIDALYLDPKVTVKRILNTLAKQLNTDKNAIHPSQLAINIADEVDALRALEMKKSQEEYARYGRSKVIDSISITHPPSDEDTHSRPVVSSNKKPILKLLVMAAVLLGIWVVFR